MSTDSDGRWKPPWGHNTPKNPDYLNNLYNDDDVLLIIEDTENSNILKETFPPKVFEGLPKAVPQIKSIRRLKTGLYEIKVSKKDRTDVLKIKSIKENIPIKISESRRNYTKATIYCDYLNQYTDDDQLTKDLKNFNPNVIDAKIKKQFKDNKLTNTNIAILTLDQPTIPPNTKVKLFYESLTVREYYPDPQLCKTCYTFGHISTKNYPCSRPKMCGHCGESSHDQKDGNGKPVKCEKPPKCINCNASHPAWVRSCPKYSQEKSYIEYSTTHKISVKSAKEIINKNKNSQPKPSAAPSLPSTTENTLCQKIENLTKEMSTQIKILTDLLVNHVIKPNMAITPRKRPSSDNPHTSDISPAQGEPETVSTWSNEMETDESSVSTLPSLQHIPQYTGYISDGALSSQQGYGQVLKASLPQLHTPPHHLKDSSENYPPPPLRPYPTSKNASGYVSDSAFNNPSYRHESSVLRNSKHC